MDPTSTVWLFNANANANFKMTLGPSTIHLRDTFGCGLYHSSVHSGRPVIVIAGGLTRYGQTSSEFWDFTVPGSQWQLSKYVLLASYYIYVLILLCMRTVWKKIL